MHFPDEKIIYTIPIYSMPKKEFKRRWDKWKNDWRERSQQMEHSEEETEEIINSIMNMRYPQNVWEYNQIVGFVEIAISRRDVSLNVQKTLDTRIRAVGKVKHYIQDMMTNDMHFPIGNMINSEIVMEIDEYLDSIEQGLTKPFCLYRDTYNNVKNYIDFNEIHNKVNSIKK